MRRNGFALARRAGVVEVTVTARAAVPLDQAWTWWTDYGEPGEWERSDHGFGKGWRRVTSHTDNVWTLEERALFPRSTFRRTVELYAAEHRISDVLEWPARQRTEWRFAADGDGTRITRVLRASRASAWLTKMISQRDLDFHVKELQRALARG